MQVNAKQQSRRRQPASYVNSKAFWFSSCQPDKEMRGLLRIAPQKCQPSAQQQLRQETMSGI